MRNTEFLAPLGFLFTVLCIICANSSFDLVEDVRSLCKLRFCNIASLDFMFSCTILYLDEYKVEVETKIK